jgi:MFS family permease
MKKAHYLTPVVVSLSLVSLFTDIASELLYPIMPVFLSSIGFSVVLIGLLEGLAEATAGLSKGYFGHESDRIGRRMPFIQWGYGLSALAKPLMVLFAFPLWIFFVRTLDRFGKGIRTGARDAMLSDEAGPENKGKVFGFHRALDTLGAAIGPALALLYLYYYPENYKPLFLLAVIPGIIAILLTFKIKDRISAKKHTPVYGRKFLSYLKYWKQSPKAFKLLTMGMMAFTFFNSSDAFLLLHIKNQTGSDSMMISSYILYNMVYALAAFPIGMLADRFGLRKVLIFGLFVFSLVYLSLGFASSFWHFIIIFIGYGFYAAATEGISKALITNISSKEQTATAIGFYTSFSSIFIMMASFVGGLIWYNFSAKTMFVFSGTGTLLVLVYFLIVSKSLTSK